MTQNFFFERCDDRFRGVATALTADLSARRRWSDMSTFDFAVGLGFDFVFFPDATALELKTKMDKFMKIVRDINRSRAEKSYFRGPYCN